MGSVRCMEGWMDRWIVQVCVVSQMYEWMESETL